MFDWVTSTSVTLPDRGHDFRFLTADSVVASVATGGNPLQSGLNETDLAAAILIFADTLPPGDRLQLIQAGVSLGINELVPLVGPRTEDNKKLDEAAKIYSIDVPEDFHAEREGTVGPATQLLLDPAYVKTDDHLSYPRLERPPAPELDTDAGPPHSHIETTEEVRQTQALQAIFLRLHQAMADLDRLEAKSLADLLAADAANYETSTAVVAQARHAREECNKAVLECQRSILDARAAALRLSQLPHLEKFSPALEK